jgi:hypothetical protein
LNLELNLHRRLALALAVVALVYAAIAGLRTVNDFDLGWQLATGRYVLQHHAIPATDVFSYTARGNPWIYPPFSGVLFYLLWRAGGFAALSWLGAAASVATVGLLLWAARGNRGASFSALLALIAVPVIAFRTAPRADLFTTLLFAAFLAILSKAGGWRLQPGGRRQDAGGSPVAPASCLLPTASRFPLPASRLLPPASGLLLLPFLMVAWVNLHLGFIAGLALLAGWVASELLNALFAARRAGARLRLRQAAPWLAAAGAATLLNPWGPWIYAAIVRQGRILKIHSAFVGEWGGVPVSLPALRQALDWRSPDSAYWWLLAAAIAAFVAALWRRQPGPALLLAAAIFVSLRYVRFQALFAMVTIVTSGELLSSPESRVPSRRRGDSQVLSRPRSRHRTWDLGLGTRD